jgi:ATP-dependent Clp protease ATP-binding subunit ClpX
MRIRKLRCSFCRKTEDQISKLVAGPRLIVGPKLYICDECVAAANSIMQRNPLPTPTTSGSLLHKLKERWHDLLQRGVSCEASVAKAP